MAVEDLYGSFLVNVKVSFATDFMCAFRDDFCGSHPTFVSKKISKIPREDFLVSRLG